MMQARLWILAAGAVVGVLGVGGCDAIWGVHVARLYVPDAGGGGGGGTGGMTGGGGTGGGVCAPGATKPCYSGPAATEGVGLCKGGTMTCKPDGTGFSDCVGEMTPQPETCADTDDNDCDGLDCVQWAELFGNLDDQLGNAIAVDAGGNTLIAGSFLGAIPLPAGSLTTTTEAAFLIKLDPKGTPLWGKGFKGSTGSTRALAVAVDAAGNVFMAGVTAGPASFGGAPIGPGAYVAKFDGSGKPAWSKGLTAGAKTWDKASALACTAAGDVIVGGSFSSAIDFGDGPIQAPLGTTPYSFVARLRGSDGSGKVADGAWAQPLCGTTSACFAPGVAVDGTGAVFVAVNFIGSMSFGSNLSQNMIGSSDVALVKVTADGVPIWGQQLAGAGANVLAGAGQLSIAGSGDVVLAGQFSASVDFGGGNIGSPPSGAGFVARYGADRSYRWTKLLVTGNPKALAGDAAGNVVVAGTYAGSLDVGNGATISKGGYDIFAAKLSDKGSVLWSKSFGDAGDQDAAGVALTAGGDPVFVGSTNGILDFGSGKLMPAGQRDVFVAKLSR
jgi:hypothetical protein